VRACGKKFPENVMVGHIITIAKYRKFDNATFTDKAA
jgi:hypothetical protein